MAVATVLVVGAGWSYCGGGSVDVSGLDPRRLLEQDYHEETEFGDCSVAVCSSFECPEYGECVEARAPRWQEIQAAVRERAFREGKGHACNILRGRYVDPDAGRLARDAFASADLQKVYREGWNQGVAAASIDCLPTGSSGESIPPW